MLHYLLFPTEGSIDLVGMSSWFHFSTITAGWSIFSVVSSLEAPVLIWQYVVGYLCQVLCCYITEQLAVLCPSHVTLLSSLLLLVEHFVCIILVIVAYTLTT